MKCIIMIYLLVFSNLTLANPPIDNYTIEITSSQGWIEKVNFGEADQDGLCIKDKNVKCVEVWQYALWSPNAKPIFDSTNFISNLSDYEPRSEQTLCWEYAADANFTCKELVVKVSNFKSKKYDFDDISLWTFLFNERNLLLRQWVGYRLQDLINNKSDFKYYFTTPDGISNEELSFKILKKW